MQIYIPHAAGIDAEIELGIVPYSEAAATANTAKLNAALAGQWKGGQVVYANGSRGFALRPIRFHGKEYFFNGTIKFPTRLGAALYGVGTRSYLMGSDQFNIHTLGGMRTQFTRLDGQNGGAIVRLCGHGAKIEGITLLGRKYSVEDGNTGPTEGTATPIGIEVEGRANPATGGTILRDVMIGSCTYGIACRDGYHNVGTTRVYPGIDGLYDLEHDESHADSGVMDNVSFFECPTCFWSDNAQAIIWSGRNLRVGGFVHNPVTVFNLIRNGNVRVEGLELMRRKITVLSVNRDAADWPSYNDGGTWKYKNTDLPCPENNPDPHDYSPNVSQVFINDMKWDGFTGNPLTDYITLFKYAGPNYSDYAGMEGIEWCVRMTGHLAHPPNYFAGPTPDYDATKLIEINDTPNTYHIPRTNLLFDILNLPTDDFTKLGDGPWWYPTPPV